MRIRKPAIKYDISGTRIVVVNHFLTSVNVYVQFYRKHEHVYAVRAT